MGVYVRALSDVGKGVGDGFEPEGYVATVREESGVGPLRASAVEVMDRVDGDAEAGDERGDAVKPEVYVAASSVEEEDRWMFGGGGLGSRKADGAAARGEGELHGLVMHESQASTLRGMLA